MTSPDSGSLLLALLAGVVAAIVAVQLAVRQRWAELAPRGFRRSRLFRMLATRGIAPLAYLRITSRASQRLHLQLCEGCSSRRRCDVANRAGGAEDYGFCPNGAPLDRIQIAATAIGKPTQSRFDGPLLEPRNRHRRSTQ